MSCGGIINIFSENDHTECQNKPICDLGIARDNGFLLKKYCEECSQWWLTHYEKHIGAMRYYKERSGHPFNREHPEAIYMVVKIYNCGLPGNGVVKRWEWIEKNNAAKFPIVTYLPPVRRYQ
jgi:hypothetical protein